MIFNDAIVDACTASAIGESMSTGHYSSDNDTDVQRKSVSVTLCPSQAPNELDWLDLGLSCHRDKTGD